MEHLVWCAEVIQWATINESRASGVHARGNNDVLKRAKMDDILNRQT